MLFPPHRPSFQGYAAPTQYAPRWYVGFLVYQAGVPRCRAMSMTGGGQIYGHEMGDSGPYNFPGVGPNVTLAYTPGVHSFTGSGQIPSSPAELAALLGGILGTSST